MLLWNTQKGGTSDAIEFEVACLCNLALAYIKLGSMDEAEEACSQALNRRRSCAKALFRRGLARLALGRPIEASSDFGEVCLLEPNNAEATNMLNRSRRGETDPTPPPVAPSRPHGGEGNSRISAAAASTNCKGGTPLPPETAGIRSSGSIGEMEDAELEQGETQSGVNHHRVDASCTSFSSPSAPSFMVPGWLASAEREQGERMIEKDVFHLDSSVNQDRSKTAQSGGVEGAVSVSKLVSQLSLSHNGASSAKTKQESQKGSGTAEAVQAEWLSLQAEENTRVLKTHAVVKELQEKAEKKKERRKKKSVRDGQTGRVGPTEAAIQTSQWWQSLEEEENKVRQAFRARLSVGGKLSTKVKKDKTNP